MKEHEVLQKTEWKKKRKMYTEKQSYNNIKDQKTCINKSNLTGLG